MFNTFFNVIFLKEKKLYKNPNQLNVCQMLRNKMHLFTQKQGIDMPKNIDFVTFNGFVYS